MTPEPLVVIESYVTEPEPLSPGQPFTLTLRVMNVGAADARRVMLTLGKQSDASKSAPIAPLGTGNVRYLPELGAGAQAEVVNQFIVDGTGRRRRVRVDDRAGVQRLRREADHAR